MTQPPDLRLEPQKAESARGPVVAPGLKLTCLIMNQSSGGGRVRLARSITLHDKAVVIDLVRGMAMRPISAGARGWRSD